MISVMIFIIAAVMTLLQLSFNEEALPMGIITALAAIDIWSTYG